MALLDDVYESKWFRAADLKDQPGTYTIERVVEDFVGQGADKKKQLVVTFREHDKPLGLNKTNASSIGAVYGRDTDDWHGEQVILFPTMVDYQGNQVEAVRVNQKKTLELYQQKMRAQKQGKVAPAGKRPMTQKDVSEAMTEIVGDDGDPTDDIPF